MPLSFQDAEDVGGNQTRIQALRDRIQTDKRQLEKIKPLYIYQCDPLHEMKWSRDSKKNAAGPSLVSAMKQKDSIVRENPMYNDHVYDAMDAYIHEDLRLNSRRHGKVQRLYLECHRRIQDAEALLEKATSEQSIRQEISSLRECIEICLEEIRQRHEADTKLSDILFEHLKSL